MESVTGPIRLRREDLPAAAKMVSRAFANDPFMNCLFPDPASRPRMIARTAMVALRYGQVHGEVQAVSPNLEGVAVWFPPGRTEPGLWDMLRFGLWFLPFSVGIRPFRMIEAYCNHTKNLRARHASESLWCLQLLGVDPARRGTGCGGLLLRDMLARLDHEGASCCLDTENEANVALYEHFGFRVVDASEIPGTGCRCWFMMKASNQ